MTAAAFRAHGDAFNARDPERLLAETETVAAELTERFTFQSGQGGADRRLLPGSATA